MPIRAIAGLGGAAIRSKLVLDTRKAGAEMPTLMLLRHGKSDWDSDATDDFARPLAKRGREATKRMGAWMRGQRITPDHIVSSPARRARETAELMSEALDMEVERIHFDERLYLADTDVLTGVVRAYPPTARCVMLIGHNPGFEDFLNYLCGEDLPVAANGKLMPTAALARVELSCPWRKVGSHSGRLLDITRPKDL